MMLSLFNRTLPILSNKQGALLMKMGQRKLKKDIENLLKEVVGRALRLTPLSKTSRMQSRLALQDQK